MSELMNMLTGSHMKNRYRVLLIAMVVQSVKAQGADAQKHP